MSKQNQNQSSSSEARESTGGFRSSSDAESIPEGAKSFIKALQRSLRNGGIRSGNSNSGSEEKEGGEGGKKKRNDLTHLYEDQWAKLTERYFKSSAWTAADVMAGFIDNEDENDPTILLYKEMYFRHIFAKMTPTVDDKFDSFQNYADLFNHLLSLDTANPAFELPLSWLWDILDEFIYQFQTFHLFRNKVSQLTAEEVEMLKENEHMWSAQTVVQYLHALVRKAGLDLTKKAAEQTLEEGTVSTQFRTLGYFSLVGLLRVNALLCDYPSALKSLDPIDLRANRSIFTSVLACHVTLYYYMGLSYLMSRRYVDSIKVFTYFLTYIQRNKHLIPRSYQADVINKRVDQMLGLLGIAYILSGAASTIGGSESAIVDENILNDVKDKLEEGNRFLRMKQGEIAAFEEVLGASSPKFLTVSAPNYDAGQDVHTDALALQLKVFISEVKQRLNMTDLYTYLKLFTTLSINKLAVFLRMDEEATLALLLKLSHKMRNQRWVGGAPGEFVWQHFYQLDFTVVKDQIHVHEQRTQRRYGDFFLRQTYKFEELSRDVQSLVVKSTRR